MSLAINGQMPSNVGDGAASPTSPRTVAFTNPAGTLLYVWVGAATDPSSGAAVALTSVTYGGTAMSLVASQASDTANNRGKLFLYRLLNPATGSNNIVVTWSGTFKDIEVGANSFTGNDTTAPEKQSVVNHGSGTSATAALTGVTSGNISIAAAGAGSAFSAQSQTLDWAKNVDNNTYMGNARASTSTASGAVTHGFTLASDSWAAIAVEVAAASGGGTTESVAWSTTGRSTPAFALLQTDKITVGATGKAAPSFTLLQADQITTATTGSSAPSFSTREINLLGVATSGHSVPSVTVEQTDRIPLSTAGQSNPRFGLTGGLRRADTRLSVAINKLRIH